MHALIAQSQLYGVEDPKNPNRIHILHGTSEGIAALEFLLRQRFADGRELGRAEMADLEDVA